jgi:excisionase family DNA binding protein
MSLQNEPRPKPLFAEKRIWVTPKEAIRISGISHTRLYELIKNRTIKSIKLGGKRLISYESIETLG